MRFFSFLLLLGIALAGDLARAQGQQGWVQVPSGSTGPVNSLSFPTRDTAFAWGDVPLRSVDGGLTWQGFVTPVAMLFQFVDGQHGFTAGPSSHTAYHTSDGGLNWTSSDDSDQLVQIVCAVTPDTCFLGGDIYLSRTTDAGKTWHGCQMNVANIEAISFYDSKHGILVGDVQSGPPPHFNQTAGCFTTSDGGVTWVEQYTGASEGLAAVAWSGEHILIATGGSSYVMRSSDAGVTWDSLYQPGAYLSIASKGSRLIAVGHVGAIITSVDSGLTWQFESSGVSVPLYSVAMQSDSIALASGANGLILRTTDGGADWVQVAPPSPIPLQTQAFPQPETTSQEIEYSLPQLQHVTVRVYDLTGHIIQTLLDKELQPAGEHRVTFRGDGLPAGTYIYHIDTERYHASGKSILVK
jgi:photosystem II stability/assembly factor-like uncharacterized protein